MSIADVQSAFAGAELVRPRRPPFDGPRPPGEASPAKPPPPPESSDDLPVALDLRALARSEPQPPAFIVPDWLPAGEVTLLAGHGGAGKSQIGLALAVSVALPRDWYGLSVQPRRVAYLSLEDPAPVLHWRLARLCAWHGVGMDALAGRLTVWDASAADAALLVDTRDGAVLTHVYDWLAERVRADGVQVVIIDGASDAFSGNEIARAQVRRFVRALRRLIPRDGAVLLLAHVDKATARNAETTQGYSGSTAWSNSVRARWYLRPADDDSGELLLEVQKSNFGAVGHAMRLRWSDAAHVFVRADEAPPATRLTRELAAVDEREAVLRVIQAADAAGDPIPTATRGDRSAHAVSEAHGLPAALRGRRGRSRYYAHVEALRAAGMVRVEAVRTACRHFREVYRPAAEATARADATARIAEATAR